MCCDCFRFLAPNGIISCHDPMTKRSVLSLASKMFDPMGLISPFTVRGKILFQELWRKGLQWNDPLDSDTKEKWSSWKSDLLQLKDVTIPRCFGNGVSPDHRIELHGFGDASRKVYRAAVYIRITDKQGQVSSQLVMSSSRVFFFFNATQLLTLQYKKDTVLRCNNKYYLQWGTNTTKIQIHTSLTVHWSIYNTLLILLTKLLHRREREKEKKNHVYLHN